MTREVICSCYADCHCRTSLSNNACFGSVLYDLVILHSAAITELCNNIDCSISGPSTLSKITSKPCNNDKATVVEDTFDSVNMSDVLGLCSARFIDSQVVTPPHSDTARLVSLMFSFF